MQIERITIEGGFLDGLDLPLSPGLNVLIGGRGTGKTSVIECLRFCLGVPGYTEESEALSRQHALAVLEDGQITVFIKLGGAQFSIKRSSTDSDSAEISFQRSLKPFPAPIMFSQTEIEQVGLSGPGRLRLIDSFLRDKSVSREDERTLITEVRSLTAELKNVINQQASISSQLRELEGLRTRLAEIEQQEKKAASSSKEIKKQQLALNQLTLQGSQWQVANAALERTLATCIEFLNKMQTVQRSLPKLETWPEGAGEDLLVEARRSWVQIEENTRNSVAMIQNVLNIAKSRREQLVASRAPIDAQARSIRKQIDDLQQGAGAITRQAAQLREKIAGLTSLVSLRDQLQAKINDLRSQRGTALDSLDQIRENRFRERQRITMTLTNRLSPRIRVSSLRGGEWGNYANAISHALRGSGLRYAELANQLAASLSPRELGEMAESGAVENLAEIARITKERAARVVAGLGEHGIEDILTVPVEDKIDLELLDGRDYKSAEDLSVGQRCTVILPIMLEHEERVLVVDQPEDHLDNAFVVETLIKAIRNRNGESQMIVSTHNANIPVLGDASKVITMGSDGQRGFVSHSGPLQDVSTIEAINSIMEGGRQAFARRAQFYGQLQPR